MLTSLGVVCPTKPLPSVRLVLARCTQEPEHRGERSGVLQEEDVPAVEQFKPRARNRPRQEFAVGRRSDPVVAAATHEGRATDLIEAVGGVVVSARLELERQTFRAVGAGTALS